MKIENLQDYPMQLDDERVIGAAGTDTSRREYGLEQLSERDQRRIERGLLRVVADEKASSAASQTGVNQTTDNLPDAVMTALDETLSGGRK